MSGRLDTHQHLWTEPVLAALAARSERPRVRRRDGDWLLELPGEPDYLIDREANDPRTRARLVEQDGVDLALVAPSSPAGIEALPAVVEAYVSGAGDLPDGFGAWGAVALADADPARIDAQLDAGLVGLTLPASAIADPHAIERCGPLLERLERRDAPLFVHPGPAPVAGGAPVWWGAMTSYVAQMNAAWHAFLAHGRGLFPSLRVAFAMLAGLAPLHGERLRSRGGPANRTFDENVFYDTSSYGPRAIDAMVRAVGIDQLVYGSDRPLAEPLRCPLGEAARHATLVVNPARLLGRRAA